MFNPSSTDTGLGLGLGGKVPAALVGAWVLRNAGDRAPACAIFADGRFHNASQADPYSVSKNGRVLDWNTVNFNRQTGEVMGLNGLWMEDGTTDYLWFFHQGRGYELDGLGYAQQFNIVESKASSPAMLQVWPLRAMISADETTINFTPIYATQTAKLGYAIDGAVLTMTMADGSTLVYDKAG